MKTRIMNHISKIVAGLGAGLILSSAQAAAPVPIKMCAFMFMGEGGPEHQALLDYQAAALNWGAKLEMKSYVNDKIVAEELKSGTCDIANMPSLQARAFNKFTGTLDAPASMPTYAHLETVLQTLAKPSAAKYMRNGDYEIIGIQPAGAVFIFTNDKTVKNISDLAGKKMAVLDTMPEMRQLVVDLGMTPVSSTLTNIFQKFNNKAIDITGAPAFVYDMMELHKGLEPNGGILENPVMQGNTQFVGRTSKLPEGFAQKSREYFVKNFDQTLKFVREAEEKIPKDLWIPLGEQAQKDYRVQTRQIRISFRDDNIYDAKMLTLLRKIRCKKDATLAECTSPDAE
ncbi:hypothetical protein FT643_14880 [Ketobacter sp. MCCC 1A13808]|uniref:putative solute-binding protein n=1 Tax=Ketobacter sp. MCCC 1A13808 TaxID=2602738 RepID=UPI000F26D948|nr:putative solute-binding protein [Ketobacter sp. MCCC 1A13808]MVF13424.1 hypothetical protein [Ketobacter sp. MCCC 1A13808]RLP52943.1 MAG: hypothetical protein D6160_18195 [Ketobacter sp.]